AVNCAAIPDNLIESELFGVTRGAFTGADKARRGRFACAHKGTLFLDEIGDLGLAAQAKLLRAIEEGEIQPLGAEQPITLDVRFTAVDRALYDCVQEAMTRAGGDVDAAARLLSITPALVTRTLARESDPTMLTDDDDDLDLAGSTPSGDWTPIEDAERQLL